VSKLQSPELPRTGGLSPSELPLAFDDMYEDLVRTAARYLEYNDCHDVVHVAFCEAVAKVDRFASLEHFRRWMFRVVSLRCRDVLGSRIRDVLEADAAGGSFASIEQHTFPNPEEQAVFKADLEAIRGAIRRLPERDRELLGLLYIEQWSSAEVAERFGLEACNVRVLHCRALKKIRRLLGVS